MGRFGDRRLFRRYKHKADFYISCEGSYYKASTVDFSLNGLCIFIEGIPSIEVNSAVTLSIEDLDLNIEAIPVWIQKTDSNILVGFRKMTISGLLKHYPLSDVLLDLQRSDATGVLELKDDPVSKQIFIKGGTIVFASSNYEGDRIEEILLRDGKITNDQYYQVAGIPRRDGKSQSKVLVEMGYIKPHDLLAAVKHQCEEIVLSLFQWDEGRVSFIEGELRREVPTLKLSAANLIFNGIKRINKPDYFHSICPPLDTILYYSEDPINLFQEIHFSEKDQYVFSLIDSKITIREMLSVSTEGELQTLKIICALLSTRMIKPIGEGAIPDKSIIKMIREPQTNVDPAFMEKVGNVFGRLESSDYYNILGIGRTASQEEIKKAFYKCAKEFHPDRHFGASSDALKDKLNAIFAAINDANRVLSNPAEKTRYDSTLYVRPPKPETDHREAALAKFQEGKTALKKGRFEDAAVLFGQAVYLDNTVASYHFCLGTAYAKQNKFHEAVTAINTALGIEPLNADYTAELGHLFLRLGFKSRAKSTLEKAVRLDPSNKRAFDGLASVQ